MRELLIFLNVFWRNSAPRITSCTLILPFSTISNKYTNLDLALHHIPAIHRGGCDQLGAAEERIKDGRGAGWEWELWRIWRYTLDNIKKAGWNEVWTGLGVHLLVHGHLIYQNKRKGNWPSIACSYSSAPRCRNAICDEVPRLRAARMIF